MQARRWWEGWRRRLASSPVARRLADRVRRVVNQAKVNQAKPALEAAARRANASRIRLGNAINARVRAALARPLYLRGRANAQSAARRIGRSLSAAAARERAQMRLLYRQFAVPAWKHLRNRLAQHVQHAAHALARSVPLLRQRWSTALRASITALHTTGAALATTVHRLAQTPVTVRARQWWQAAQSHCRYPTARLRAALVRPPTEGHYRMQVATPASRHLAAAGAGLVAVLIALPAFAGRDLLHDLIFVFTMLALAQHWNLLAGYAGLVSVGQQAFVGLGGYLLFALTIHAGLDPLLAILLAGPLAAALALPTALVVFRLRGSYFAIGTWVMAEVYRLVFAQFKQLGGGTGTSLPPSVTNEVAGIGWVRALFEVRTSAARDIITYWAALVLAIGTLLLVYLILRSRHGLALAAIRDSETAAESVGVDSFKTKLSLYVITAAATGMVGALIYLQKARISPDAAFSVLDWTAYVIFIVVIGGIGTIEGPIIGVLVLYVLQTNLAHLGTWYLMLLGLFGILVILFAPKGIWGYVSERYQVVLFPLRRRLVRADAQG